jgi:hypothetical protein
VQYLKSASRRATLLVAVLAVGCEAGDGAISALEKVALANALFNAQALEGLGPAAGYASFIFTRVDAVGTLDASTRAAVHHAINASISGVRAAGYDGAVGIVVIYDVTAEGENGRGAYTGVVGWRELDTQEEVVAEAVSAGAVSTGTATPFESGNIALDDAPSATHGLGTYWNQATQSAYVSTSGSLSLTATSFAAAASDCSASANGITVACSYRIGTMTGAFAFEAERANDGTGPETYSQSAVSFTALPAVRVEITITGA